MPASSNKLDHVACGVASIAEVAPYLEGVLGARPYRGGPNAEFNGRQWSFANGALLEIIEPAGETSFVQRFLAMRGAGIHHVTFKVPDIHQARDRARLAGFEVVGFDDRWPSWKECFLHPRQAQGIVVQFAENHPELSSEDTWGAFAPVVASPAEPAVSLLGVRLASRDLGRARAQWHDLIGAGIADESPRELTLRWEGCPLHLHVVLDRDAPEGPLGLEVGVPAGFSRTLSTCSPLGARLF